MRHNKHRYCPVILFTIFWALVFFTPLIRAAGQFPLTVKDQFNRVVTLSKTPQRIVSGSPGNTEILFALGLEKRIVGVTNWCTYPEPAKKLPKIGDISPMNIERVLALQPDLVVADVLNGKDAVDRLNELSVPVLALNPNSFQDILAAIRLIGLATGRTEAAGRLMKQLETTLKQVRDQGDIVRKRGLKVFIVTNWDPYWTAGPGSYLDEAVNLAGGINIARDLDKPWGQLSMEAIIARNPDLVITDVDPAKIYSDPNWATLAAVRKHQVYKIIGDEYYRPGPRLIMALRDLAALLERSK